MATVSGVFDVLMHVYASNRPDLIGQRSVYADTVHPGTGKKIDGWFWDQRTWPTPEEFEASEFAPSIWDPLTSGIDDDLFQSGYGDNNDILLLGLEEFGISGVDRWSPQVNHGYFYSQNEEWYLYSDAYQTNYFTVSGTISGLQFVDLEYDYKPTIPIQIKRYRFDPIEARFHSDLNFRKVVEFSDDPEGPEFKVDTSFDPPRVWLDGEYNEAVGIPVVVSGDVTALERLGVSDGTPDQEFQLAFHPIDRTQPVEVWTWGSLVSGINTEWTVLSGLQVFTPDQEETEVYVDYDRGIIRFGNHDPIDLEGSGRVPSIGHYVSIYYTKGLALHYEPKNSIDYILATTDNADTNPISSSASSGFVQVATEVTEPGTLTLDANLPQINPFLIELGNNVGEVLAEVKSKSGQPLEGQEVTFEILDPQFGTFGATARTVTAITGADGIARTFYNAPVVALDAGVATTSVEYLGNDTLITAPGLVSPGELNRLYLYKVHSVDEVLGMSTTGVNSYYSDYLEDQGIEENPDGSSVASELRSFEQEYRTIHDLPVPETYEVGDISTGKKTLILTAKLPAFDDVIDPNTGDLDGNDVPVSGVLSPLYPSFLDDIGTDASPALLIQYNDVHLELPGTNDTKAYFIVGDVQTSIRAYVVHPRTRKKIYSNPIEMKVTIPDGLNGVYFVDDLNALPDSIKIGLLRRPRNVNDIPDVQINATSGIDAFYQDYLDERTLGETYLLWFRRTRRGDTQGLITAEMAVGGNLAPEELEIIANGELPLGFRLKSTGLSIASILDQVTFINPNDNLPVGFFTVSGYDP